MNSFNFYLELLLKKGRYGPKSLQDFLQKPHFGQNFSYAEILSTTFLQMFNEAQKKPVSEENTKILELRSGMKEAIKEIDDKIKNP
jgi:hypothetical protein